MAELIFIGTLHCGFTNNDELKKIILYNDPDYIFVEIFEQDIQNKKITSYPEEMIFVVQFADENNIPCKGFDSKTKVMKDNLSEQDELILISKQKEIIDMYDWKEFNNPELNQQLSNLDDEFIDAKKWNQREIEMKFNIEKNIPSDGTVLIITGSGHIPFFKKQFPDAKFPLIK